MVEFAEAMSMLQILRRNKMKVTLQQKLDLVSLELEKVLAEILDEIEENK